MKTNIDVAKNIANNATPNKNRSKPAGYIIVIRDVFTEKPAR
jgi:hypothetical protein